MYLEYFNLRESPFHITPNPEFLYLSPSHLEALATITYGVEQGKGFMALVGEVGLGKTTLIQTFLKQREGVREKIIYLFNGRLSFIGLLRTLARELDLEGTGDEPRELLDSIYQGLIREYARGNNVILLIDEAQSMPEETLEGLRLISNLETPTEKLIQIVLVGQPELSRTLDRYKLRQLKQRIAVRATLSPLTREESLDYIQFRLKKSGGNAKVIFTRRALERIVRQAKGIPRAINILCDNALITGCGYQQQPVSVKVVNEVISDLAARQRPFSLRWIPASLSAFFVIVGVLGLSVYYQPFSSGARVSIQMSTPDKSGPTVPITRSANIKEVEKEGIVSISEFKPVEERAVLEPAAQDFPAKKEALAYLGRIIEPTVAKERPKSSRNPNGFPFTRAVREGENLYRIILEVYGASNPELWDLVRKQNPKIKADLKILVGQKIIFPEWKRMVRNGEQGKEGFVDSRGQVNK
jgi:general secretion pathway protein A